MIKGQLIKRVEQLAGERVPFVLATVVRARRPTSVRAGDSAVVLGDGTIEGFVGGDCATSSVRLHSRKALETGEPVLLRLVPGDGEASREADAVHGTVIVERNPCLSGGALEIFLEPQLPAPRVVVIGDAPIARALADVARAAGYDVVVADSDRARSGSGDGGVVGRAKRTSSGRAKRTSSGRATRASWSPPTARARSGCSHERSAPACRTSRWSPAGRAGPRCAPTLTCPTSSVASYTRPPGSTSGRGHRPRLRSRSWPS